MSLDFGNASFNFGWIAGTFDNSSIVFGGDNLASVTEYFETSVFEAHTLFARDDGSAGEDSDILHDFFATITESWGF